MLEIQRMFWVKQHLMNITQLCAAFMTGPAEAYLFSYFIYF